MKHTSKLLAVLAALGIASSASAGLIGENYLGAGIGYAKVQSAMDGWAGGVQYNTPAYAGDTFGVDVLGSYSYLHLRNRRSPTRMRSSAVSAEVLLYAKTEMAKPYVMIGAGWTWDRFRDRVLGLQLQDDTWHMSMGAGFEINIDEKFSVTPAVSWTRYHDYSDDAITGSLDLHYWITEKLGLGLGYALTESGDKLHTVMASGTYRF